MRQIRFRDIWELRGPHMDMSNLEQPTYGPRDNNMPQEEDTALEEPGTQRLSNGKPNLPLSSKRNQK